MIIDRNKGKVSIQKGTKMVFRELKKSKAQEQEMTLRARK
jgi:hypothetical protein